MSAAKQLIPALVEAEPLTWDRAYSKNMRPIRGYPDYWRIIDTEAFIDGPPEEGGQYNEELFLWRGQILTDENFNLTDTVEVVNLGDYLTVTSSQSEGETTYRYKYNSGINSFQYQHTDPMDSISIEFDQSGRRLLAYESTGNVFLLWFDPVAGQEVAEDFGAGYTPYIVTDNYNRLLDSSQSERLLFFVKDSTKQIVYYRQSDRYDIEYTLPDAPNDVVEILKVSKNIYGGLTVLYCYEDTSGDLVTGSFTARSSADEVNINTDRNFDSRAETQPTQGSVTSFTFKLASIQTSGDSSALASPITGTLNNFELRSANIMFTAEPDSTSATPAASSGSVSNFVFKSSLIDLEPEIDNTSAVPSAASGAVSNFTLKETLIIINTLDVDTVTATPSSTTGSVSGFVLG